MAVDFFEMILGRGIAYPMTFTDGKTTQAAGVAKINACLTFLFDTMPGELFFMPEFGTRLRYLLFEHDVDIFKALAESYAEEAIERWLGTRIKLIRIAAEATGDDHLFRLVTTYEIVGLSGTAFDHEYELRREV